jgi:tetratricopeptide (TPR) repeat protein
MAFCYEKKGNLKKTAEYYEKAHRADPCNTGVLNNLATTYAKLQNFPKAIECFERILKIKPDFKGIDRVMGDCLFSAGRIEQALEYYHKVIKQDPENQYALTHSDICCEHLKMQTDNSSSR